MTDLIVLGSGGAFSDKFGNTQFYVDTKNPKTSLLIDCGCTWLENARTVGPDKFKKEWVHNIFITHLHDDHSAGLGTLALMHYFYPHFPKKPKLFVHRSIASQVWPKLAAGLETLADHQLPDGKKRCQIDDYFDLQVINDNDCFHLGDICYRPIQSMHVVHGAEFMSSYGLEMTLKDSRRVVITGDTQFAPDQLRSRVNGAKLVFHDCETGYFPDGKPMRSGVHAHLHDIKEVISDNVQEKIAICHYGDNFVPEMLEGSKLRAVTRGDIIELD